MIKRYTACSKVLNKVCLEFLSVNLTKFNLKSNNF